ncbi:hypothetical protein BKK79_37065 (plasmid) [Cupriavidus sp. USMAA2-4]|nr:hypothetical protein BKK79_37065 [Cupriavidus sp. USMAA2-4]
MDVSEVGVAVRTGGVRAAILRAYGDVFTIDIEIRDGTRVALVAVADRKPRTFRDPASAMRLLQELGIPQGSFELSGWTPQRARDAALKRPDRSRALKAAHRTAAADREFRRQVEELLALAQTAEPAAAAPRDSSLQTELAALLNALPVPQG